MIKQISSSFRTLKVTAITSLFLTATVGNAQMLKKDFEVADKQYKMMLETQHDLTSFPRSTDENGAVKGVGVFDWTGGFFPGVMWYIYEYTKDPAWLTSATKWTTALEKGKDLNQHHDIGFVMYCSYGNALRLEKDPKKIEEYNKILIHSAKTALTRFDPKVGLIKSWNRKASWDGKTMWQYPVIIDNMMNLEMLCYVSKITGDPVYKNAAISHAVKTMENHFRSDYSTYHVVDYDPQTGKVLHQQTNQGYSDNSTWSRGQGWAIYGFTMMYRETGDKLFLEAAKKAANFYLNHPNLPKDKIPYWDFNVGQKGYQPDWKTDNRINLAQIPRDASAGALVASGLLELSTFVKKKQKQFYFKNAETMQKSLSSDKYLAKTGTNGGFILKHSVGSFPHNFEVDAPLVYADYYFLEALLRYQKAVN
ncbi:MAG: glycoside hydrolase family 88 protein [Pedobacter sp.]